MPLYIMLYDSIYCICEHCPLELGMWQPFTLTLWPGTFPNKDQVGVRLGDLHAGTHKSHCINPVVSKIQMAGY